MLRASADSMHHLYTLLYNLSSVSLNSSGMLLHLFIVFLLVAFTLKKLMWPLGFEIYLLEVMQHQKLVSPTLPTHAAVMTDHIFRFQRPGIFQFFFNLSFPYLVHCYAKSDVFLFLWDVLTHVLITEVFFFSTMYAENRCPGSSCEASLALCLLGKYLGQGSYLPDCLLDPSSTAQNLMVSIWNFWVSPGANFCWSLALQQF